MLKKWNLVLLIAAGVIFSAAHNAFSAREDQRTYDEYEYDTEGTPRSHAEGHSPQTHGLTGAEGSYGKSGSGTDGYIVGGTPEEEERYGEREPDIERFEAERRYEQERTSTYPEGARIGKGKVDEKTAEKIISGWKDQPKKVAQRLMEKYGPPDAASQHHLIWYDNGPWVETKVVNEEILHKFPKKHYDVVTQTVKYKVPVDKVDELIDFDGGLIIDRTAGELSAMCHNERMNTLALNLADDIVKENLSVEEAREKYAEQVEAATKGQSAPLTQRLQFDTKVAGTADPGESIMGKVTRKGREGAIPEKPDETTVQQIISEWREAPRTVAQQMIDEYGVPDEATNERLIWHNNGPWKRTEVVNQEIPHDFPVKHKDIIIQTVDYQVPSQKVDELVQYNGSIVVNKTRGEISSHSANEKMNILTLNLAGDIVEEDRDPEEVREVYTDQAREILEEDRTPSLAKKLQIKGGKREKEEYRDEEYEKEEEDEGFLERVFN
ncbi:MAG: hypothetical protein E3K32_00505 [wastewater metagenome]|nr:hypothetical protein [Candidatus Loosdrechtia aerotolerans]